MKRSFTQWLVAALFGAMTETGCSRDTERYAPPPLPQQTANQNDDDSAEGEAPVANPSAASAANKPTATDFRLTKRESNHRGVTGYHLVPQFRVEGKWCGRFADQSGCFTMPDEDPATDDGYADLTAERELHNYARTAEIDARIDGLPRPASTAGLAPKCWIEDGVCYNPRTHICGEVHEHEGGKFDEGDATMCRRASERCCSKGVALVERNPAVKAEPAPAGVRPAAAAAPPALSEGRPVRLNAAPAGR